MVAASPRGGRPPPIDGVDARARRPGMVQHTKATKGVMRGGEQGRQAVKKRGVSEEETRVKV